MVERYTGNVESKKYIASLKMMTELKLMLLAGDLPTFRRLAERL
jgi:hypothetical protein